MMRLVAEPISGPEFLSPTDPAAASPRWEFVEHLLAALDFARRGQEADARARLDQAVALRAYRPFGLAALAVATPDEIRRLAEIVADNPDASSWPWERAMQIAGQAPGMTSDLSERERQVLDLLRRGMTNRDIARELYISANTVKFHRGNVMRKLSASTRQELLDTAARLGL